MATVICRKCKEEVEESARECPVCLTPVPHARNASSDSLADYHGPSADSETEGDPFSPSSTGLHIATPWGARVALHDNERLVVGRNPLSPWASRLGPHVSWLHAQFRLTDGALTVEDTRSLNGTFVNDERLRPFSPQALSAGDVIRLGRQYPCVLRIENKQA